MARKVTPEQLLAIVQGKQNRIVERGREIVRDNGEYGAELVRDTVETSGTVGTGKRGRIETGDMLASVDSEYDEMPDGAKAVYGFVKDVPRYTRYQEHGTQNIEAMNAVEDADMNVQVDFKRDIDRMMREEWGR